MNASNLEQHTHTIKTVGNFFKEYHQTLHIPEYQRPYKWEEKHVNQLLEDIKYHSTRGLQKDKTIKINYRLGAIVLHHEKSNNAQDEYKHNIVDGQQRTVTLLLLLQAIINNDKEYIYLPSEIKKSVEDIINKFEFPNEISHTNILTNFNFIKNKINQGYFTQKEIDYLLNHCELVIFQLNDISEAFQFFDSQNARGKSLEPHDLLKAFHLREFKDNLPGFSQDKIDQLIHDAVKNWEEIISQGENQMKHLFSKYLYPIRRWVKNKKAFDFTKEQINEFKGVNFTKHANYPFVKSLSTLYSQELNTGCKFSYQLDQPIINGYHFFEMVNYYNKKTKQLLHENSIKHIQEENKIALIHELNKHGNHGRKGDKYVRDIFDAALFYYLDKFTPISDIKEITAHNTQTIDEIMSGIDYIYYWAYRVRLENLSVYWESIENHICNDNNLFKRIKLSTTPFEVTTIEQKKFKPKNTNLDSNKNAKNYSNKLEHLIKNFKDKGLLYEEIKTEEIR